MMIPSGRFRLALMLACCLCVCASSQGKDSATSKVETDEAQSSDTQLEMSEVHEKTATSGHSNIDLKAETNKDVSEVEREVEKRRLDSIGGNSAFQGFGKRRLDSISGKSAFQGFGKRRLDSISGNSAFQGFGKRRLDSINGNNAFQGFGKRRLDSISGNSAFQGFGKRRLDSISGNSAFQGFGKRRLDSIGGSSAFRGFGKRRLDSIGGSSAFRGFGKRRLDSIGGSSSFRGFGKRRLDSISGNSAFQGFGKRRLDSIGGSSSFRGFGKRRLDSIGGGNAFREFGKRDVLDLDAVVEPGTQSLSRRKRETEHTTDLEKRSSSVVKRSASKEGDLTLSLTGEGETEALGVHKRSGTAFDDALIKRRLDSITRGFGSFGKRSPLDDWDMYLNGNDDTFDENGGFEKRRLDRISNSVQGFRSFGKRGLDRIGQSSGFRGFGKRRLDRIGSSSGFRSFGKRRLDRIAGRSSFWKFGKRSDDGPINRWSGRIGASGTTSGFGKADRDLIDQLAPELLLPVHTFSSLPSAHSGRGLADSLQEHSAGPSSVHTDPAELFLDDITGAVPAAEKRRLDSIGGYSFFRRFGRNGFSAAAGRAHLTSKRFPNDEGRTLDDDYRDIQDILDTEFPELAKALSTDQGKISEREFHLALAELIDLISNATDNKRSNS